MTTTPTPKPLIYQSNWIATIIYLIVTSLVLWMIFSSLFEEFEKGVWTKNLTALTIGIVMLTVFIIGYVRELVFAVRKIELYDRMLTLHYPFATSTVLLSHMQDLTIKQEKQKKGSLVWYLYLVRFKDEDHKQHRLELKGKIGAQLLVQLIPFANPENVDIPGGTLTKISEKS